MKKIILNIVVGLIFASFAAGTSFAQDQQKLAQTGMKFMNAVVDARGSALGEAMTSLEGNAAMLFFNPAGVARNENLANVALGSMTWIADIKYLYGAATFTPFDIRYGVFGITAMNINYGDLQETIRFNNEKGYMDIGTFRPYAFTFGFTYANALSDKFAVGGSIKYAKQSLGAAYTKYSEAETARQNNVRDVMAFDFGVLYKTGFKSLNFGMTVRNFSKEIRFEKENFQLPLTFKVGLSMDAMDLTGLDKNMHSFLVSVDAAHYRDYPEQILVGAEYTFMNTLSLRAGFDAPADERSYSLGVGLKQSYKSYSLGVDYSYTPFGVFDSIHRIAVNFTL
ncbi:MAG: PorV/PorQ family protein [Bacillota bacterium]